MNHFALKFVSLAVCLAISSQAQGPAPSDLYVGLNKSNILENANGVKRISIANPEVAEAVAVSKTEVLVNGKAAGETSLVLWDQHGQRTMFDVHVTLADSRPEAVRAELQRELPGQNIDFDLGNGTVFLRGLANDVTSADRAAAIVATLGKVVNLLKVKVPEAEPQILLKVRFANVDRSATQQLGLNIVSTGATHTIGGITTGQFGSQPTFDFTKQPNTVTFTDLLNVFLLRPDLNLAAEIEALEAKQVAQILAEPNLLTVSGRPASFLAGGEFPYPTLQGGGAGVGQVTIQFREFGVRIHFFPVITPRGTIRLSVTPEVSSLDPANGLTVSGYTVPGLATRRVQTEVELENGQSFVIAGLLDNRTTENLSKIPGLSSIPLLGKLFESRQLLKNNSELLVMVTPELVKPLPRGAKGPEIKMPLPFMKGAPSKVPQNPTDPAAKMQGTEVIPIETLKGWSEPANADAGNLATTVQPLPNLSNNSQTTAANPPAPAAPEAPKGDK
jgi:pilus assembly protein CpaC